MSGPITMYHLKQIVRHDFDVQLPCCMYKLENIHGPRDGVKGSAEDQNVPKEDNLSLSKQNNQNVAGMAELEARQEQILQQLTQLKKQMEGIRKNLNITKAPACAKLPQAPAAALPDIVINASPSQPPYSLELLQKLLQRQVFLAVTTHLHSSVSSLTDAAAALSKTLQDFTPQQNSVRKVNVRLIWKDVGPNIELIVTQTPIQAEANILRFLSRFIPSLNYENSANPEQIDSLLDTSYLIVKSKTKTERAALLQVLNKSLGKNQFLAGRTQVSVADLAAYSALKQAAAPSEVNVNLGKWVQRLET